jgi:hypothetical protein
VSGRYARGQHGGRAEARARWREAWRQVHTLGRTHREAALRLGVSRATIAYYAKKGKPPGAPRELDGDVIQFGARRAGRPDAG